LVPPPLEAQNRAAALSYYACAPLTWLAVSLLLIGVMLFVAGISEEWRQTFTRNTFIQGIGPVLWLMMFLAGVLGVLAIAGYWGVIRQLLGWLTARGPAMKLMLFVLLPVLWLSLGALLLGVVPIVLLYVFFILKNLAAG